MNNIIYKCIGLEFEPKIIGVSDLYQVKLFDKNDKKYYSTIEEKHYYQSKFIESTWDSMYMDGFEEYDPRYLPELLAHPYKKKAKQTDFIKYAPSVWGIDFIVSKKCFSVLNGFTLHPCNIIKTKIHGWDGEYFAIGFPWLKKNQKKMFEFFPSNRDRKSAGNFTPDFTDVIHPQGRGIFFSKRLSDQIISNSLTGIRIHNSELIYDIENDNWKYGDISGGYWASSYLRD